MTNGAARAHLASGVAPDRGGSKTTLLTLFTVALAFRFGAWWLFTPPEPNYNYWLARGLITLHAFALGPEPTSFIEPLYPAFLALGMFLFNNDRLVLLVQAIVSASGAPAMYLLGWRLTGMRSAGVWAALLYAADPYFVRQAHSYIELPFALPLLLWTLERLVAARRNGQAVAGGVLAGLVLADEDRAAAVTAGNDDPAVQAAWATGPGGGGGRGAGPRSVGVALPDPERLATPDSQSVRICSSRPRRTRSGSCPGTTQTCSFDSRNCSWTRTWPRPTTDAKKALPIVCSHGERCSSWSRTLGRQRC